MSALKGKSEENERKMIKKHKYKLVLRQLDLFTNKHGRTEAMGVKSCKTCHMFLRTFHIVANDSLAAVAADCSLLVGPRNPMTFVLFEIRTGNSAGNSRHFDRIRRRYLTTVYCPQFGHRWHEWSTKRLVARQMVAHHICLSYIEKSSKM